MIRVLVSILAVASASVLANEAPPSIKPQPLTAVKSGSDQYNSLCAALKNRCDAAKETTVWKSKADANAFYLINSSPELMKIEKAGSTWTVKGTWDFSQYHHSHSEQNQSDDELSASGVTIYPALYPLGKNQQAVALVSQWSTGYSGGGREENYADFMQINEDGSYKTAFKDILFSSREMIRACFSEQDYARNLHCHDESWRVLQLKIRDEGKAYYSWEFITKSSDWPSFTDKSAITTSVSREVKVPFAGGVLAP